MTILTTGVLSGLGRYIHENLGGIGLTRRSSSRCLHEMMQSGVDIIIHCAFNSKTGINSQTLYPYFEDNVLLTKELVTIPHKKFILFSTVDVYPKNSEVHSEDEIIDMDSIKGVYRITKLMSESIAKRNCENYIILRPTTPLGRYSRKNTLLKIMDHQECVVGLSGNSRFNYILHSDVLDFIKFSIEKDLQGTYNVASAENIILSEVANIFGKKVQFGTHMYDVGKISNTTISALFPTFRKTSTEVLVQFFAEWKE